MCNDLPKLHNQDGGTWRRIEVVPFISRFTDNPQPTPDDPNQFIADIDLSQKLDKWKLCFILTLLSKYQGYLENGTNPPYEVKAGTESYKQESDIITSWFNSDIEECEPVDGKAPTNLDTLFDYFKEWCANEGIDKKELPPKKKVRDSLISLQEKSKHKAKWGKDKMNGLKQCPYFTFIHII